jgi:hypothetical protein
MKMRSKSLCLFTILLLIFLTFSDVVLAQEDNTPPAKIQLAFDQTTLKKGQSGRTILVLRNTTPYTLADVSARLQETTFTIISSTDLSQTLSPHTSTQAEYTLQSLVAGSQNVVFKVQYSWDDPQTGTTHHWGEVVSVDGIEVTAPFTFNWPDYLIPLLIGFAIGQFGAWYSDWRKQRQERRQQEEQARGITLAMLQAARKGVQAQEKVSFSLWEEAIVKGNLYPALHQLGRTIGQPELSKRLAELSITLADYNERQAKNNLTEKFTADLLDELTALITIIENRG